MKNPSSAFISSRQLRLCDVCASVPLSWHTDKPMGRLPTKRHACRCPEEVYICYRDKPKRPPAEHMPQLDRYQKQLIHVLKVANKPPPSCARGLDCFGVEERKQDLTGDGIMSALSADQLDTWVREEDERGHKSTIQQMGHWTIRFPYKIRKSGREIGWYDDENSIDDLFGRENRGEVRAWCTWCNRVIPGPGDPGYRSKSSAEAEAASDQA
ncbi:MAG: hypothetical protein M1833_000808 [Piccolia ochrophora]|nr:MAG: hypothetical protein M1833_000808 [Piccolia ochrophora]